MFRLTMFVDLFNCEVELRIQELQGVLGQLGSKVEGVTALYGATVEEVQRYVYFFKHIFYLKQDYLANCSTLARHPDLT